MLIFLFIAISYMASVAHERDKIKEIAVLYNHTQNLLFEELKTEFEEDLYLWNAVIDSSSLSVRFLSPEILFSSGSTQLKQEFKTILSNFFPRYIGILMQERFIDHISEIRIEGHTSSEWTEKVSGNEAYLLNMELSQNRTREVLKFCLDLTPNKYRQWVKSKLTANGLSSSKLLFTEFGDEDRSRSRRVEFRVRTDSELQILKILTAN